MTQTAATNTTDSSTQTEDIAGSLDLASLFSQTEPALPDRSQPQPTNRRKNR